MRKREREKRRTAFSAVDNASIAETGGLDETEAGRSVPLGGQEALGESACVHGVGEATGVWEDRTKSAKEGERKRRERQDVHSQGAPENLAGTGGVVGVTGVGGSTG
jgi:hypothetical protein